MKTIVDDKFLSKKDLHFIENGVLNSSFPFYWNGNQCYHKDGSPDETGFLSHTVVKRVELRSKDEPFFNSKLGEHFVDILNSFCNKNKVKYKKILRIAVNLTFNVGRTKSLIHNDHDFPYKQLLVYLTDNKNAPTVLLSKDKKKVVKEVRPKKYRGFMFNNYPHYMHMPKEGKRIIIVYTFV
ncbi:MAG TPA: hypothetical protein DCS66_08870 [Flavobacteriaceae bacterium]|nr:hypothetical protein [Flavobacteriaceae bacterium]